MNSAEAATAYTPAARASAPTATAARLRPRPGPLEGWAGGTTGAAAGTTVGGGDVSVRAMVPDAVGSGSGPGLGRGVSDYGVCLAGLAAFGPLGSLVSLVLPWL